MVRTTLSVPVSVRQLFAFAQDLFHIAPGEAERELARVRLNQCLFLAVLLHVWLVVVMGSAPGGQAAPGEGAYGSLSVRLQGPVAQAGANVAEEPLSSGPPGKAPQQRSGGMVRPIDELVHQDRAGAETAGAWRALESPNDPNLAPPVAPEIKPLSPSTFDAAPELPRPTATLTDNTQPVAPARPQALSKLQTEHAPSLAPLPGTAYDALRPAQTLKDTAQRAAAGTPLAPAKPTPNRTTDLAPLPETNFDALRPAKTLSDTAVRAAAVAAPPSKLPSTEAATLAPLPSNALDSVQPRRTATLSDTAAQPTVPAPEAPSAATKLPDARLPDLSSLPKVQVPSDLPAGPARPAVGTTAPSNNLPSGAATSPSPTPGGSPNAGSQQGHDVATPPSVSPDRKPLNLNLPLARGPMASSGSGSGILPVVPKPPDTKTTMEKAVKQGERPDCRKVYSESELKALAIVPLAIQSASDKGCKW